MPIQGVDGTFGIAVKDLATGRGFLVNPDLEFPAASLFKLPVMFEVFKQNRLGLLSMDEELEITEHYAEYDLGTLDMEVGDKVRLARALERMIVVSDNTSAVMLLDRTGVANVNRDMKDLGLEHTRILAEGLTTSPQDMLLFMEMLAMGKGVDPETSQAMVQLLLRQQVNDRIPLLLPRGTPVAHKTGNWDGIVHDVGIVFSPRATYVIALLAQDLADVRAGTRALAEVSREVYDYFN